MSKKQRKAQEKIIIIMIRRDIISVIGDVEIFIDSLLAHTEEENCNHSVSDFLQEYFDNKNKNGRVTKALPTSAFEDKHTNDNNNNLQLPTRTKKEEEGGG